MRARYKPVSHGCLITLCADDDADSLSLTDTLRQALRSGQSNVWVDCRHVASLPAEALLQLRQCAAQLWQLGSYLIACHLSAAARASLVSSAAQPLAASLLDADFYGLDCP